jgi:hypothetical protein
MDQAGPNEVYCSDAVPSATADDGLRFDAKGRRALKGFPGEYRLFQVMPTGDGAPPDTASTRPFSPDVLQWRPAPPSGSGAPDLIVACAAQIPAGPGLSRTASRLATQLRGESREDAVLGLLNRSPLTAWFARESALFHTDASAARWELEGYNAGEHTRALLAQPDSPVWITCSVHTGWQEEEGDFAPAVLVQTEMHFALLELDRDRRRGEVRHETLEPPAPGALDLNECVDALAALLAAVDFAASAGSDLAGVTPASCDVALHLVATNGATMDRVIDLTRFAKLRGTNPVTEGVDRRTLRVVDGTLPVTTDSWREVVVSLVDDTLMRSGFRGTADFIREISPNKRRIESQATD